MLLIPDARRRVTLPKSFKTGQPLELEDQGNGTFLLIPVVTIAKAKLVTEAMNSFGLEYAEPSEVGIPEDRESETGFAFIFGGPYSAIDILTQRWGKQFPESVLMEAAEKLEDEGGTDWSPRFEEAKLQSKP